MTISPDTPFDLIHVGKCGGSSVVQELTQRGFQFEHFHMRRPTVGPERRYVILVRDPVARFVSAFNFRHHVLSNDLLPARWKQDPLARLKQQAELSFLSYFQDVNHFCENLVRDDFYDVTVMATILALITHVPQGFSWYLDDLLDRIEPAQLLGVIAMERFCDDFETLFRFRPTAKMNRYEPTRSNVLSPLARSNLVRELEQEYQTLARLTVLARRAGVPMSVAYEAA